MGSNTYAVTLDSTKTFEIRVDAEVPIDSSVGGLSEAKARVKVAAHINAAIQSLEQHGVHIEVIETSGYGSRDSISEFKATDFDAANLEGGA